MPAYPFNPSPLTWNPPAPYRAGAFSPRGQLRHHGASVNPSMWTSKRTMSARLVVGFSVGKVPTWSMSDLVPIVERVRQAQSGNPSATFVSQRGIYQHHDGSGVVHEDGAQVFIINMGTTKAKFKRAMIELAETVARELKQESVILEIQENGISKETHGIIP